MQSLLLILVVLVIIALVFLLLGVKVFFHQTHRFPEYSTGKNRELKKRGIGCARHEEIMRWKKPEKAKQCGTCCEHAS